MHEMLKQSQLTWMQAELANERRERALRPPKAPEAYLHKGLLVARVHQGQDG